ncbi:MAG: hypothetical protein U9R39_08430 [Campylobacterota bacterium]|nr:hypothetical protein [Campylobacterota bacterium]
MIRKKNKLIISILMLPCVALSFDLGLDIFKDKYVVSIKKVPIHKEPSITSDVIEVLNIGDKLIKVKESELSNKNKVEWVKVKSKKQEELAGYVHYKTIVTDSLYQDMLNTTSTFLDQTNKSVDSIPVNQNKNQMQLSKKNKKGFSDEERIDRNVKKGFVNTEDNCQNCNKKNNDHLKKQVQMQIVTRNEIKNFAEKGELR